MMTKKNKSKNDTSPLIRVLKPLDKRERLLFFLRWLKAFRQEQLAKRRQK